MDLKQLRHFVALADHRSFSAAAEAVAISQPALTRSIKLLEVRLGVTLFDRHTRRVALTEAGERLHRRAKLILNEAAAAERDVQTPPAQVRSLKVGMAPMFASNILPAAMTDFSRSHPNVEIEVTSGLFDVLAGKVLEGELDIAFSNLPYAQIDKSLLVEPLFDIDVVYLASRDHPLAGKPTTVFTELTAYPWAVIDETHANDLYGYIFASQGETTSPIRLKTNSLSLLKSLVRQPPWITLLPRHMVEAELTEGLITALEVPGERVSRRGGILVRAARMRDANLSDFAETLRRACEDAI
jgi:DNA-binding transcriptional LysR family regulator